MTQPASPKMNISFSYLQRQFADPDPILAKIRDLVVSGSFTLGEPVDRFERRFAEFIGARHAVSVGSGTDALFLSMKALGISPGDEVITAVNTFVATAGAIETAGAKIRFVDCNDKYVMDVDQVEAAITPRTKAIVPVHYTGQPVDMDALERVAEKHGVAIIEDACTAIDAAFNGRRCGTFGAAAGFSLHPLKNLNIWGDGGVITTNLDDMRDKLLLLRNHGMSSRDSYAFYAYNSRLDTIQAVVADHLLDDVRGITDRRIEAARRYDAAFAELAPMVRLPPRDPGRERCVYHLYIIRAERRDALRAHLAAHGVRAKVHYPIPLHLQPASAKLGYRQGDFPMAERQAADMLTLPAHQHLTDEEIDWVIARVREFYQS